MGRASKKAGDAGAQKQEISKRAANKIAKQAAKAAAKEQKLLAKAKLQDSKAAKKRAKKEAKGDLMKIKAETAEERGKATAAIIGGIGSAAGSVIGEIADSGLMGNSPAGAPAGPGGGGAPKMPTPLKAGLNAPEKPDNTLKTAAMVGGGLVGAGLLAKAAGVI